MLRLYTAESLASESAGCSLAAMDEDEAREQVHRSDDDAACTLRPAEVAAGPGGTDDARAVEAEDADEFDINEACVYARYG